MNRGKAEVAHVRTRLLASDTILALRGMLSVVPIPATSRLPLPNSDDEFDDMVADALAIRFGNASLVRFGRRGQRQQGIDGLDPTVPLAQATVWQSTLQKERVVEKIEADLSRVDPGLAAQPRLFVAALGINRDANVQARFLELMELRVRQGKCAVMPLFWEDVSGDLCSKDEIARKWFPTLFAPAAATAQGSSSEASRDAAYWESIVNRMVADWLNWCVRSGALSLMHRVPIVRIARTGASAVVGFPVLGRWDLRMGLFAPTHGNGGADTVRVGRTDVRLSTIIACDDRTETYLARLALAQGG